MKAKCKPWKPVDGETYEAARIGNVAVKLYRRARKKKDGESRFVYELADYSQGRRRLRGFTDLGKARKEAERLAGLIATGETTAAQMLNGEALAFGRAIELLRPTGVSLEVAAAHFAEAFKILGSDKVIAAAQFYRDRAPDTTAKTVAEVVAEVLAQKEARGRTENTVSDLRARLNKFSKAFRVDAASVTTPDVQTWLDGLKVSERTRLNYRAKVFQLFQFSERRGYIPKGTNPVAGTERPQPTESDIEIYTPGEVHRLLDAAKPAFRMCIALGAFAGLRSSEVQRLEWPQIDFAKGTITASAKKRGTPSRRLVPITDNLRAWLAPHARRSGLVWLPREKNRRQAEELFGDAQTETAAQTGDAKQEPLKWKTNGLRHSFISYRLADLQDTNRVALEAGNSPGTIFKHYRELVGKSDAEKWFAIAPDVPANVVTMGKVGA